MTGQVPAAQRKVGYGPVCIPTADRGDEKISQRPAFRTFSLDPSLDTGVPSTHAPEPEQVSSLDLVWAEAVLPFKTRSEPCWQTALGF